MAPQSDTRTLYVLGHQLGRHSSQPRRYLDLRCALRAADGRLGRLVMPANPYLTLFLGFATVWLLTSFAAIGYSIV
jgi:hypothetical protein